MAAATLAGILVVSSPAHAVGAYNNASIADNALSHLGENRGTVNGQCKQFANDMVKAASSNTQSPSGYQSGWAALGTEVSSANAVKGDIIQITPTGSTDSTAESIYLSHMDAYGNSPSNYKLHTTIIVSNNGGGSFSVVDANFTANYTVGQHAFMPYSWANGSIVKIWRLGTVSSSGSSYADGTYVQASDTGRLYRMAGGSPMYVTSLSAVPWTGSYVQTTQAAINAMPMYPADGTEIRSYGSGGIFIVAGGFPFAVASLSNIPPGSWTDIDNWDIANQLRSQPADGTVVRNYLSGGIYVVTGNARTSVASLADIPPGTTWTNIDGWAIANQLNQYPTDGSVVCDYLTGTVYVFAGHAAVTVVSFANIPPVTSMAYVDDWSIHNEFPVYPVDGTVIRDQNTGGIFVMAGGAAIGVSSLSHVPYTSWVHVDGWAITHQFRSYPASGTYIKGYQSGEVFVSDGSAITRVYTTPPTTPTIVDDSAISSQLGGTL